MTSRHAASAGPREELEAHEIVINSSNLEGQTNDEAPTQNKEEYCPYEVNYYNAQEGKTLDFFIYAPHGGKVKDFLEAHPDFTDLLNGTTGLARKKVEQICNMEEDTFTPELADSIATILAAQGYRVAVMKVLVPREVIDMGRAKGLAHRFIYNFKDNQEIYERHCYYYEQVETKRREILGQLHPEHGKWLNLHTMRSFDDDADTQTLKTILGLEKIKWNTNDWENFDPLQEIDWTRFSQEEINSWYEERIQKLIDNAGVRGKRPHCMVAKNYPQDQFKADLVMVSVLKKLFDELGIKVGIGEPYFLCSRMSPDQIESLVNNGLLVDLVKEDLARNPKDKLDKLKADPEKIQKYAVILAKMLFLARMESKNKN